MKFRIAIIVVLTGLCFASKAGSVDTILIRSEAMDRTFKCVVVKPQSYKKGDTRYPVVYLLHGYGGWYSNWILRAPELTQYADDLELIIVCPDGAKNSWYLDSPVDSSMRYETYIGREIPAFIDAHYRTKASPDSRAITGLSMGGYGGLFLGLKHPDLFGAFGSMSGAVNIRKLRKSYEISSRVGDTSINAAAWPKFSVLDLIENYKSNSAIIIDCGIDDPFFRDNVALHEKMLILKISHEYIERPGKHDWNYWKNSVAYQLYFFSRFFQANNQRAD